MGVKKENEDNVLVFKIASFITFTFLLNLLQKCSTEQKG